ncbi:uncharacterized protein [Paramisgurnus dabryanus]|uniref:uncharacterized protein isoform X1 n=2 Tax=Paramisgurnus dabryanus TaxID=90735 RepID=UPI0031F3725A
MLCKRNLICRFTIAETPLMSFFLHILTTFGTITYLRYPISVIIPAYFDYVWDNHSLKINAEFMRITTVPLLTKFFGQLDRYTANLHKVFKSKGGASGQKISRIVAIADKRDDIHLKRDCVIKSLCVYLNEDITTLVKEFMDCNPVEAKRGISETTLGIYAIRREGAGAEENLGDVVVVIEGVMLLQRLKSISFGVVILFRLIYALNLSYPKSLKFTFEFFQKVLMNLDGNKLSPKVL